MPGGAAGLQNQSGGRKVPGGFDSLPSPPNMSSLVMHSFENRLHDLPGFLLDLLEMFLTAHAFCVDFAQILSSGWAHGEPAVL